MSVTEKKLTSTVPFINLYDFGLTPYSSFCLIVVVHVTLLEHKMQDKRQPKKSQKTHQLPMVIITLIKMRILDSLTSGLVCSRKISNVIDTHFSLYN